MERIDIPRGITFGYGYLSPIPPEGDSWDEWVITRGIAAALRDNRDLDDRTAHYIAAQLHEGQASALYSLASTGAIDEPRVHVELTYRFYDQTEQVQAWINWLGDYCLHREDKGPVDGWHEKVAEQDRIESAQLRQQATVADLDAAFGMQADEEIWDADEANWFGLVHREGRPGGLILSEDREGLRSIWETDSAVELVARWAAVNEGCAGSPTKTTNSTNEGSRGSPVVSLGEQHDQVNGD
jgi:hypothetical protein